LAWDPSPEFCGRDRGVGVGFGVHSRVFRRRDASESDTRGEMRRTPPRGLPGGRPAPPCAHSFLSAEQGPCGVLLPTSENLTGSDKLRQPTSAKTRGHSVWARSAPSRSCPPHPWDARSLPDPAARSCPEAKPSDAYGYPLPRGAASRRRGRPYCGRGSEGGFTEPPGFLQPLGKGWWCSGQSRGGAASNPRSLSVRRGNRGVTHLCPHPICFASLWGPVAE